MPLQRQIAALMELAESMGIAVRRAPAMGSEHPGGALVRLKGKDILFLDPTAPSGDQLEVAAAALRGRPELADRFLPPEIRELLE